MKWLHAWYVTLRYGSRFTRSGRALRSSMADPVDSEHYVEVCAHPNAEKPSICPDCGAMVLDSAEMEPR